MAKKPAPNQTDDPRPRAVSQIWGAAIGMLALCIPLCFVIRTAALPVFVIAGASLVTLYIWTAGAKTQDASTDETEALRAKIKELEERLANVEVINRFEDRLAEKRLQQALESQASGAAASQRPGQREES